MIHDPILTVLMTVHNGEPYLKQAMASVLNQTYKDFKFLILDNASTDNSREIIYAFQDPRLELTELPEDIGQVLALNRGLKMINTYLVARIDADDIMDYKRLEEQVTFLNSNPDIAVVGSYFKHIDKDGNYLDELRWPVGTENNFIYILTGHNPVGHPGVMFRKNVIERIGYYRDEFKYSEDTDLWFRIYKSGYCCDNIPKTLTYCRKHSKQSSLKFKERQHKNHVLSFLDFYTGLVKKEISYIKIEQYLNVMIWKSKKLTIKSIGSIIIIFWNLFEKLIFIHRDNNVTRSTFYNGICNFYPKIFIPFELLVLIRRLSKTNTNSTGLIKPLLKRINK